jgi:hypothetical protein
MALGGGVFVTQNKVLPGSYINFVSASAASATLSDRGVAAFPIVLSWGADGKVFTVTAEEFQKDSLKIFGYPYTADELAGLRDLFLNIKACHFYKLNSGGAKASCTFATAKHPGVRGNTIMIAISASEGSTAEKPIWDVVTFFDGVQVDEQLAIENAADLQDNDYVVWVDTATLATTAGTYCSGGTDGNTLDANYQSFLDAIESYSFNTVGTISKDDTIKQLFATWTKRMRDEVGIKFQCVLYKYADADFEGVISVENKLVGEVDAEEGNTETASLVYWVTGAEAGCEVNKSLTNATYTGEFDVDVSYTQMQLEAAIKAGKLIFHQVNDTVRILEDINTFISVTDGKSADFSSNQTMRVLDQIGNDIASLFNTKYLGKVPNDNAGRISLWNDIVKHHQELEAIRAIENFEPDRLTVVKGDTKKAVVVTDYVTPINAMAQLYMTVIVE